MSGEPFYKMCGSGNDFVFLDGRTTDVAAWPPQRIAAICARGTGVGADGLVLLGPASDSGAVRFTFFNSDGSRGEMCGNGALCATRLSVLMGLTRGPEVALETDAGVVSGFAAGRKEARAELLLPDVQVVGSPEIAPNSGEAPAGFAVVGVPHLVVQVDDLELVDLPNRGRELRRHAATGPAGANVNFVALQGDSWTMRTYERGVEGETLACGTGAVACALILAQRGAASLPLAIRSRSGAVLRVSGQLDGAGGLASPRLNGQARLVYRGTLGPDD